MASSFPSTRFPALPLIKEEEGTASICEDKAAKCHEILEETLLAQISTGNQEALATLFRRYARLVWSIAERIVRYKASPDDLLQDVFLLIQRRASVFDRATGKSRLLFLHITRI